MQNRNGDEHVPKTIVASAVVAQGLTGPVMAQESIRISSTWGEVTAIFADNGAARSLARMLSRSPAPGGELDGRLF